MTVLRPLPAVALHGRLLFVSTIFLVSAWSNSVVLGDEWPQWMGPKRDNIWRETEVIDSFPEKGLKEAWRVPIAGGYSGPAVSGGHVYVTDYVTKDNVKVPNFQRVESSGTERVLCLDEATGKEIWKHEYPVKYSISYPSGPRCTPIVEQGKVYTLGAEGHLFCFDAKTGKVLWQKHFPTDYSTKTALWGYAGHPLIDGQKLICVVGGTNSHAVAFDKNSGQEIWRTLTAPEQGYSPPTIIEHRGQRQLVLLRPDAVGAADPETGKELWTVPYEATSGSIIMSPILIGDYLYAAGYSQKSLLLKLKGWDEEPEVVWYDKSDDAISPVNVQPFADGNVIYGVDQGGLLCALEIPSGARLWETPQPIADRPQASGTAFIVRNGDRYWLFSDTGHLVIAQLSKDGYKELDRVLLIKPTNTAFGRDVVWSAPAFANRRVYLRNDEEIACFDLKK